MRKLIMRDCGNLSYDNLKAVRPVIASNGSFPPNEIGRIAWLVIKKSPNDSPYNMSLVLPFTSSCPHACYGYINISLVYYILLKVNEF